MSASDDPYGDIKTYHMASKIGPNGEVSALCFKKPRAISGRGQTWTTTKSAVTCEKCISALESEEARK